MGRVHKEVKQRGGATLPLFAKKGKKMAKYDMRCKTCRKTREVSCPIAERESQFCPKCGNPLLPLFTPTSNIRIPPGFGYAFSDLFGTSSEKDWLKENPTVEKISPSRFKSAKDKRESERKKIIEEGLDVERHLKAQGKLKDYKVEAGSMTPETQEKK